MSKTLGIIPSRYQSTRFPGKPLIDLDGKSMIQRVYESCLKCKELDQIIVATDDQRIFEHVISFNGNVEMTDIHHKNGTERIAEIANKKDEYNYIINIQGDEPCIHSNQIDELAKFLKSNKDHNIATQYYKLKDQKDLEKKQVVKVKFRENEAIAFYRELNVNQNENLNNIGNHIGLYGFKRSTLLKLVELKPTDNENKLNLEQLRWMDHGYSIGIIETIYQSPSIDLPSDIHNVLQHLNPNRYK